MSITFPFPYRPEMPPYVLPETGVLSWIYGPSVASPNFADPTILLTTVDEVGHGIEEGRHSPPTKEFLGYGLQFHSESC